MGKKKATEEKEIGIEVEKEEMPEEELKDGKKSEDQDLQSKEMQNELENLKEQLTRLMAEYANFRKRTEREKEELRVLANEKLISELLPILDHFDRALNGYQGDSNPFHEGVTMIQKELIKVLNTNGLKEIEALKANFDPNVHLAVMHEEVEGMDADVVTEVFQKGYQLKGKVLRASMVKVSK